ncbi:hypothetical protein GQR58_023620 [Nymphon striatum]|nr:hypothetical protein GQR58_023620 [Nymphon striatum]
MTKSDVLLLSEGICELQSSGLVNILQNRWIPRYLFSFEQWLLHLDHVMKHQYSVKTQTHLDLRRPNIMEDFKNALNNYDTDSKKVLECMYTTLVKVMTNSLKRHTNEFDENKFINQINSKNYENYVICGTYGGLIIDSIIYNVKDKRSTRIV